MIPHHLDLLLRWNPLPLGIVTDAVGKFVKSVREVQCGSPLTNEGLDGFPCDMMRPDFSYLRSGLLRSFVSSGSFHWFVHSVLDRVLSHTY